MEEEFASGGVTGAPAEDPAAPLGAINKDDERDIVKGTPTSTRIIDNLFGVPDKIVIPERYIPETVSNQTFV